MKTKSLKNKLFALASIATLVFFVSCNDEKVSPTENFNDLIDESYTSQVFDEIEDIGDEAVDYLDNISTTKSAQMEAWKYNRLSPCATITKVFVENQVSITIDFGDENCLCNDGRERRGKILINHYGTYWNGPVEIDYAFDNYFVDDNQLIGTKNVLRTINDEGNRYSEIIVEGAIILADDAGTITWNAERNREVIEGSDTRTKIDDKIEVTGFSNGTLVDGTVITCEITTPLIRICEPGCFRYFVSGVRTIVKGEEPEITIDYGDGTCDNLADITKDGVTTTVEIKRRRPIW